MATLATLRARCRLILASVTDWPDADLNGWIADAVCFYSMEFPRALRYDLTLATGTRSYDLPAGCMAVTAVEYPAGEDPAEYLARADEWSALFQTGGDCYALRGSADTVAAAADSALMVIVFARAVVTGEHALISYLGLHRVPATDTDVITVPEAHSEALIAFVDFRAHWALETEEAVSLSNVSIILSQLGQEARLAWRRYKEVVDRLQALTPAPSGRVVWSRIGL
jgi:hypothetical protein